MNLGNVIANLSHFDPNDTIYAAEPWTSEANAAVAREPDDGSVAPEANRSGMTYFLEVSIALEFCDDLKLPPEQLCDRVIQYAINDA